MSNFFYLPEQHHHILKTFPHGQFYTMDNSGTIPIPFGCAPVFCRSIGDWTDDDRTWVNPFTLNTYTIHPLNVTIKDASFFDEGFYEITPIEGLTFDEGEAWNPNKGERGEKIRVEKTDPNSIWDPYFKRYSPPCQNKIHKNRPNRIKYHPDDGHHALMCPDVLMCPECRALFVETYCRCNLCNICSVFHQGDLCGILFIH
jgi:hypothetical protein